MFKLWKSSKSQYTLEKYGCFRILQRANNLLTAVLTCIESKEYAVIGDKIICHNKENHNAQIAITDIEQMITESIDRFMVERDGMSHKVKQRFVDQKTRLKEFLEKKRGSIDAAMLAFNDRSDKHERME